MILGIFHTFPIYLELTLHCQKTPFSIFWCFRDPNDVQMTWNFAKIIFWKEQSVGAKEVQKWKAEDKKRGPTWPDSLAAWSTPSGPLSLRCRRSLSPWLRLDLKTTIKIVPRRLSGGAPQKHRNHETKTWSCRLERKNSDGALPVWSSPSPTTSPPSPWWRGSSPPLDYGFVEVTYVSLLSLELH